MNGKVNPEANQGKDGDKYVNTETGDVSLRITATGKKKATSKAPKGDKGEQGLSRSWMVKTEHKVYQDATDVMAQQVVTDVMDATEKTS